MTTASRIAEVLIFAAAAAIVAAALLSAAGCAAIPRRATITITVER